MKLPRPHNPPRQFPADSLPWIATSDQGGPVTIATDGHGILVTVAGGALPPPPPRSPEPTAEMLRTYSIVPIKVGLLPAPSVPVDLRAAKGLARRLVLLRSAAAKARIAGIRAAGQKAGPMVRDAIEREEADNYRLSFDARPETLLDPAVFLRWAVCLSSRHPARCEAHLDPRGLPSGWLIEQCNVRLYLAGVYGTPAAYFPLGTDPAAIVPIGREEVRE